jgi:hypothetical protein
MFNFNRAFICALLWALSCVSAIGQTVITSSTNTPSGCDGGPRTGFPIGICKSGAYILSADLAATGATNTLDIAGNNISLDLNGYSIAGTQANCTDGSPRGNSCSSAAGSLYGVYITGQNVVVNGTGIYGGENISLSDLRVHDNNGDGLNVAIGQLRNISATNNNGDGIHLGTGLLDGAYVAYNNSWGIYGGTYNLLVSNSNIQFNAGEGVGLLAGQASNVTSYLNGGNGIQIYSVGQIINSLAYANSSAGFYSDATGASAAISQSLSSLNGGYGFLLSATSCYNDITTVSNTTGMVSGGAAYGTGTVGAH